MLGVASYLALTPRRRCRRGEPRLRQRLLHRPRQRALTGRFSYAADGGVARRHRRSAPWQRLCHQCGAARRRVAMVVHFSPVLSDGWSPREERCRC